MLQIIVYNGKQSMSKRTKLRTPVCAVARYGQTHIKLISKSNQKNAGQGLGIHSTAPETQCPRKNLKNTRLKCSQT